MSMCRLVTLVFLITCIPDGKLAVKVSLGSLHPAAFLAVTVNWYTSHGELPSVPLMLNLGVLSSPELKALLVFRLVTLTM